MRNRAVLATFFLPAVFLIGPACSACRSDDPPAKIGTAGGDGGDEFIDSLPQGAKITAVKIRHGLYVDSLEVIYKTADGKTRSSGPHGGDGGSEATFTLEEGEYIKGITGRSAAFVDSLVIVTNKRKSERYGGDGGEKEFSFMMPEGRAFAGFFGRSGAFIDQIGILAVKNPEPPQARPLPSAGVAPSTNQAARDYSPTYRRGLLGRLRRWR
jgi:hypothetical protein